MPLASTDFVTKGGSYYAHLFENPSADVPRALYWSFTVDFESVRYVGGSWRSSFTVEWITLGAREFAGAYSISSSSLPEAEASLYLAEHHPIDSWNGLVSWTGSPPQCIFDYDVELDLPGLDRDPVSGLHLAGKVCMDFDGFIVVPGNLYPKPASIEEAGELLRQYFPEPGVAVDDGRRYVFRP